MTDFMKRLQHLKKSHTFEMPVMLRARRMYCLTARIRKWREGEGNKPRYFKYKIHTSMSSFKPFKPSNLLIVFNILKFLAGQADLRPLE